MFRALIFTSVKKFNDFNLLLQGRTRYRVVTLDGQLIDIAGEYYFISVIVVTSLSLSLSLSLCRYHEWWWEQGR